MKVEVEITSTQKFEDHTEQETNKCQGTITKHDKGQVLEFIEKYENQELKFKMTILENKVIALRNGQTMIFDKSMPNKTTLNTIYGTLNMTITTNKIDIVKENENIQAIYLEYQIELENGMTYDNIVKIKII